jgi:thioredoxin 1
MVVFITELNDSNYSDFLSNNNLALVDIWAEWCGPCKLIGPIIDQISVDFQSKLSVGKLEADVNRDIVKELGIRNIPTILLYKDGVIINKSVGAITKEKLTEMINEHISE